MRHMGENTLQTLFLKNIISNKYFCFVFHLFCSPLKAFFLCYIPQIRPFLPRLQSGEVQGESFCSQRLTRLDQ